MLKYTSLTYGGQWKNVPNEVDMTLPTGKRLFCSNRLHLMKRQQQLRRFVKAIKKLWNQGQWTRCC